MEAFKHKLDIGEIHLVFKKSMIEHAHKINKLTKEMGLTKERIKAFERKMDTKENVQKVEKWRKKEKKLKAMNKIVMNIAEEMKREQKLWKQDEMAQKHVKELVGSMGKERAEQIISLLSQVNAATTASPSVTAMASEMGSLLPTLTAQAVEKEQ